jgi:O-antigen/teichoic acid export membrane protein
MIHAGLGSTFVRLSGMALSFFVGVQLARYLGPNDYGEYGVVIAIVSVGVAIAIFGIPLLATREAASSVVAKDWSALKGLMVWSIIALSILSAISIIISLIVIAASQLNVPSFYFVLVGLIPVTSIVIIVGSLIRGLDRIVLGQSLDTLWLPAIFSILLATFYTLKGSMSAADALYINVIAASATMMLAFFGLYYCMPHYIYSAPVKIRGGEWTKSTIPLGLTSILRAFRGQFPIVILGLIASATEIGVFRVAFSAMVLVGFPYSLFAITAQPIAATLYAEGELRRLKLLASSSALLMTIATAGIAGVVYAFGEPLIDFVFGSEYVGASEPLVILSLASLITAMFGISPTILHAAKKEGFVTVSSFVAVLIGVAFTFFLVPPFGIAGAAWAIVASSIVHAIFLQVVCKIKLGVDPSVLSFPLFWDRYVKKVN